MRAATVEALTPLALASSPNCLFHASKPAAVLPHCAAPALLGHSRERHQANDDCFELPALGHSELLTRYL
jgi:hypothetical protein